MRKVLDNKKLFLILITLIIFVILIYELIHIFAVFQSEIGGSAQFQNGKWVIYVNSTNITTGTDVSFTIDQFSISTNQHVKEGNIAPRFIRKFRF